MARKPTTRKRRLMGGMLNGVKGDRIHISPIEHKIGAALFLFLNME
jgi:hypothetical protein